MVSVLVKIFWDNNAKISMAYNRRHLFLICEPVAWLSSVRLSFESAPHVPDSKEQQIPAMFFLCRWQKQDLMVTLKASSWTCAHIAAHIPLVKAGNLSKFNAPGQGGVLHLGAGGWDMSICVTTIQPTRTSLVGQVKELRILLWSRGQIQLLQMKEVGEVKFWGTWRRCERMWKHSCPVKHKLEESYCRFALQCTLQQSRSLPCRALLAVTQAQVYVQICLPGLGCSGATSPCLPGGGVEELVRALSPHSPCLV